MQVQIRVCRFHVALERHVVFADGLPVMREQTELLVVDARVAIRVAERFVDRVQVRLRGEPAERRERAVGDVEPDIRALEHARGADAARVVRVKMNRDADFIAQGLDQLRSGVGLAQAGHVLDRQDVRAHLFERLGRFDVVFQVELRAFRVEKVAGKANRRFADAAVLDHGVHRDLHIRNPVQRIEHTENIDAPLDRFLHEDIDDIVRVIRVADGVARAEQHLEQDIRHPFAQRGQTLPRVFLEEAHARVKRRSSPHLHREELRHQLRVRRCDLHHVVRSHPRREERLMRVAHRRVGQ